MKTCIICNQTIKRNTGTPIEWEREMISLGFAPEPMHQACFDASEAEANTIADRTESNEFDRITHRDE